MCKYKQFDSNIKNALAKIIKTFTNLIREMNVYRYPEKPSSRKNQTNENENPMKKDDHAPEALGRFFRGHFGPRELRGRSRQRSSITKR